MMQSKDNENANCNFTCVTSKRHKKDKTKPKKYIHSYIREVTTKDCTLTENELELLKIEQDKNPKLNIFCNCCQDSLISDIICRTFVSCGNCYCCTYGDSLFDDDEDNKPIKNTITIAKFNVYNKLYHYTKDEEFCS